MPPKLVEHDVGGGVELERDDDAHAKPVGLVAYVGDAFDPLVLGGLGDTLDQAVLADLVGDRGQDDRAAVAAPFLDLVAGPHHDRAAPGMIGGAGSGLAEDQGRGREIWPGNILHQPFDCDRRVIHIGFAGGDDLAEIVRWNVGRHAHRDAAGAVHQQVGEARRKHLRLFAGRVVIGGEIDRILVKVVEQGHRDLGQPASVAHEAGGSGSIEPKLPWPSISGTRIDQSWVMRARAS